MINPVLTRIGKTSQEDPDPDEESEGCLSFPGERFPLRRAQSAILRAVDLDARELRQLNRPDTDRLLDFRARHGQRRRRFVDDLDRDERLVVVWVRPRDLVDPAWFPRVFDGPTPSQPALLRAPDEQLVPGAHAQRRCGV